MSSRQTRAFLSQAEIPPGRQPARELWVFGLADRGFNPSRVALVLLPNRTLNTLLPVIESTCKDGTIVHTYKWKGYNGVNCSMRFN